ncbi:MAG: T9SS type A sorting domain-containing protein [Bacteroidota bacterium]
MNRKLMLLLVAMLLVRTAALAQVVHRLPFASTGNAIELDIANNSSVPVSDVQVKLTNAPAWLQFTQTEQTISSVAAGEAQLALFSFSVEKSAPVNQEYRLQFRLSTNGQNWTKEIAVVISAPKTFELFQNYPNPFNPTTTISYQLPTAAHVTLKVFNLLGQEVATLVNGEQLAGYHQETMSARGLASGLYVYQLLAKSSDGSHEVSRRVMALVK